MDPEYYLQLLLGTAVLLPLLSFLAIFALGPVMGKAGQGAGYVATGAIVLSLVLSLAALSIWLSEPSHHRAAAEHQNAVGGGSPSRASGLRDSHRHRFQEGRRPLPRGAGRTRSLAHEIPGRRSADLRQPLVADGIGAGGKRRGRAGLRGG